MAISELANLFWYHWRRNNWIVDPKRLFHDCLGVPIDRPVFLVGNQGGGLTLVSRMLRRHPACVSISGNHTYWSGADEMQKVMMCRLPDSLRLGGRFICRDPPHPRFSPPRSWSYAADDLIGEYRRTEADYDDWAARKLRLVIGEALHRHGDRAQGKRFVDKSQVFAVKMSYVNALLGGTNPQFVLITRNPYAACFRSALGKAGDMKRYSEFMGLSERIEICAQHWSNVMSCALEDKEKVSHFKAMRFEDVLQKPGEVVRELCEFLDLDFTVDLLPSKHHSIPLGSRYRDRWYPLRPDINSAYLTRIPDRYVSMIADRCASIAEQFGYLPPKTGKSLDSVE